MFDIKTIIKKFPEIFFCGLANRLNPQYNKGTLETFVLENNLSNWFRWFYSYKEPFDLLRVQLKNKKELFYKSLGNDVFLVILDQQKNATLILKYLNKMNLDQLNSSSIEKVDSEKTVVSDKMADALRVQSLIIPDTQDVKKSFKDFFVYQKQQDVVGGDFYWSKKVDNGVLLGLIDCSGHSLEGAMASMVCNSLLNQSYEMFKKDLDLIKIVNEFYRLLNDYDTTSTSVLDYSISAEIGVFYFNFDQKNIKYISTGISWFLKKGNWIELMKSKKIIDYTNVDEKLSEFSINMNEVDFIYSFTDGVVDQFDTSDTKKLAFRGLRQIINDENKFGKEYYSKKLSEWMGDNIQYDDVTLIGIAI